MLCASILLIVLVYLHLFIYVEGHLDAMTWHLCPYIPYFVPLFECATI